jgi:hypothetical protein
MPISYRKENGFDGTLKDDDAALTHKNSGKLLHKKTDKALGKTVPCPITASVL